MHDKHCRCHPFNRPGKHHTLGQPLARAHSATAGCLLCSAPVVHIAVVADVCASLPKEVARGRPPGPVYLEAERHELDVWACGDSVVPLHCGPPGQSL
eukprot:SAG22_NODE_6895_length_797_cov_2.196275_1_plen_97_part_10